MTLQIFLWKRSVCVSVSVSVSVSVCLCVCLSCLSVSVCVWFLRNCWSHHCQTWHGDCLRCMHHVLIILTLTFIQGHTICSHENDKCLIISETTRAMHHQICCEDGLTKRLYDHYRCDDLDLYSKSQVPLRLDYFLTCSISAICLSLWVNSCADFFVPDPPSCERHSPKCVRTLNIPCPCLPKSRPDSECSSVCGPARWVRPYKCFQSQGHVKQNLNLF